MRKIKKIHQAVNSPIDDLITYRAIPTKSINYLDPFLFLNHHGPQIYPANNNGLPFGPHPHRGFETLTYVIKGDIAHQDSGGGESVITAGGVQWMTAGSGLIHSEVSSDNFKKNGGEEEVLQLWMNLSSKHKMVKPNYAGLNYDDIPHISIANGKGFLDLISGKWGSHHGPIDSLSKLTMTSIRLEANASLNIEIPYENEIFFYIVKGDLTVNETPTKWRQLVQFEKADGDISIQTQSETYILFGYGKPFNEPMIAQGPFVMNSEQEIMEAYQDFKAGKMGSWR